MKYSHIILLILLILSLLSLFYTPKAEAPILTVTKTFTSLQYDGQIYASAGTYDSARTYESGSVGDTYSEIHSGQANYYGYYGIWRAFLFFDTSIIPNGANITSAVLSIYVSLDRSDTDFNITIQNGQPTYPHMPLESGDYYYGYYIGNYGSRNTSEISGTGYWNITLTDFSIINKQGYTKLCLRANRDINGQAPSGLEYIRFYSYEKGSSYAPKLYITYETEGCKYVFYGPYSEESGLKDGNVTIIVYPSSGSPFNFTLDGTYTLELESKPLMFKWNLQFNYTRVYIPIYDYEEIHVFKPASPYFYYQVEIIDFIGLHNVYLESRVTVNGTDYIAERRQIPSGGKTSFVFTEFKTYGFRLIADEGIIDLGVRDVGERPSIFGGSIKFMVSPAQLPQNYANYENLTVTASRLNATYIQVYYSDSNSRTTLVNVTICLYRKGKLTSEYSSTYTSNTVTVNWLNALPNRDYIVIVEAEHADYGSLEWMIPCPAPPEQPTKNIWDSLLGWLGDWPITPSNAVSALIIICVVTLGSFKDAHIGLFAGAIAAGILIYLGWYSMSWGTLTIVICLIIIFALVKGRRILIGR